MDFGRGAESMAIQLGKGSDYVFIEALKTDILAARAVSIENKYNKSGGLIDHSLVQNVNCLSFKKATANRCTDVNDYVLRSSFKIPKPLMLGNRIGFLSLSNSFLNANRVPISIITPEFAFDIQYRTYTSKKIYGVYEDDKIDLYNVSNLGLGEFKGVLRGLFVNPMKVKELALESKTDEQCEDCENCNNCGSEDNFDDCFNTDTFEIEDNLFTDIQRIVLAKPMYQQMVSNNISLNET